MFNRAGIRPGMGTANSLFQAEATPNMCIIRRSLNSSSIYLFSIPKGSEKKKLNKVQIMHCCHNGRVRWGDTNCISPKKQSRHLINKRGCFIIGNRLWERDQKCTCLENTQLAFEETQTVLLCFGFRVLDIPKSGNKKHSEELGIE